jgi:hypothetical protein
MTTSGPLKRDLSWWTRLGGSLWRDIERWVQSEPVVVVLMLAAGAVLGLAVNRLVGPRKFHAWGGVTVESGGGGIEVPSILANLAAGSGLRFGGSSYPLAFQTSLMDSPGFQDSVLLDSLGAVTSTGCPATSPCVLRDYFSSPDGPPGARLKAARKRLGRNVSVIRDERSRIIVVAGDAADSLTAASVVRTYFRVLDRINRRLTAEAARERVEFLASQIPRLTGELQSIQDSLERFYRGNRSIGTSPELMFREQRLRALYEGQAQLLASVRDQLAKNELQARGDLSLVQVVIPVSLDARPVRPLRNPSLVLGVLLLGSLRFLFWRRSFPRRRPDEESRNEDGEGKVGQTGVDRERHQHQAIGIPGPGKGVAPR